MRTLRALALCALASGLAPSRVALAQAASGRTPPRLTRFVEASYPPVARAAGHTASVLLQLTVDALGAVTDAAVLEPAGEGFDEAALAAARRFRFTPATVDGAAVAAQLRYRYRFTLTAAAPAASAAPVAMLRGVVRTARNLPIANATVTLHTAGAPSRAVRTDALGVFRFALSAPGEAQLTVEAVGFRPFRARESTAARDDVQLVYRLVADTPAVLTVAGPTAVDEDEVTVRAARAPREVTRTTLERREIDRVPGTGGDALRAIQNLAGVARPSFLSGDLIVRGAAPGDTAVFVDGTDLPLLYHFGGLTSVIPTEMLERIDFYPGNFSSRFGRALGGVVDVGLRSPTRHGYHGVARLSAVDVSLFAEGALRPDLSLALAVRRSHIDAVLGAILPLFASARLTAAPVYWDYQAVLEWRPTPRDRVRVAAFGDDDTVDLLLNTPDAVGIPTFAGRFALATRFHLAQLRWTHDFGAGTTMRAMVSAGYAGTDFRGSDRFQYIRDGVPMDFRCELTHAIGTFARLHAGVDLQSGPQQLTFQIPRLDDPDPTIAPLVAGRASGFQFSPAAYLEGELTPVPGLRIVPGVRVDYEHAIRAGTIAPRVSARYELTRDWALKGGLGLYTQSPAFEQSTGAPNLLDPRQTIGNPHLLPQRAMHYALGLEHSFSPWVFLSVEGFYKTLDDLVVATDSALLYGQSPPPPYSNAGIGRVYGVDVTLRHRPSSRFFGWIAYTLLRSERRDGPGLPWHLFDSDQTHILSAVGTLTLPAGFEVGARFRYVTGSPVTPVTGAYYSADSMQFIPVYGAANSERAADFHQLDVRVDKTFHIGRGTLGLFLEVINVYNHTSEEGRQYRYDYRRYAPIAGLPIFPNLGVRGEL